MCYKEFSEESRETALHVQARNSKVYFETLNKLMT